MGLESPDWGEKSQGLDPRSSFLLNDLNGLDVGYDGMGFASYGSMGTLDRRFNILTLTVFVAAGAMKCAPGRDAGTAWDPALEGYVTDGVLHQGKDDHPSVGLLYATSTAGTDICTATLVGKRTILTAAHCNMGSGQKFRLGAKEYSVISFKAHSTYQMGVAGFDIAVAELDSAPTVSPSAIGIVKPSIGETVTIVGFGVTYFNGNDAGVKRIAKNKISKFTQDLLQFDGTGNGEGNACSGDSGGPSFIDYNGQEVIAGVHSMASMPCGSSGFDTRTDLYVDWIVQNASGDVYKAGDAIPPPADMEAPSVNISFPQHGDVIKGAVEVQNQVKDNVGIDRVVLYLNDQEAASQSAAPFYFPLNLQPGAYTIKVSAFDAAGNEASDTIQITIQGESQSSSTAQSGTDSSSSASGPATSSPSQPQTPGSFGATCNGPDDCVSGLCATHPFISGARFCAELCIGAENPCPLGGTCYEVSGQDLRICGPDAPQNTSSSNNTHTSSETGNPTGTLALTSGDGMLISGGCALSGNGASSGVFDLLGLVLILAWVQRRHLTQRTAYFKVSRWRTTTKNELR